MRMLAIAASAIVLAGCATNASERISTALTGYGLDAGRAQCVGDRLERSLSVSQLRELGRAARTYRERNLTPRSLTIRDLLAVAGSVNDPRVVFEAGAAAAACGVVGGSILDRPLLPPRQPAGPTTEI